jgi:hypothetical protein
MSQPNGIGSEQRCELDSRSVYRSRGQISLL